VYPTRYIAFYPTGKESEMTWPSSMEQAPKCACLAAALAAGAGTAHAQSQFDTSTLLHVIHVFPEEGPYTVFDCADRLYGA
jgi:hypothetical protein